MSNVNWALALPQNNLGEQVNQAFQQGQQAYTENTARNALSTLVQNPNDPKALADLAKVSPSTAMQFRQQQAEQVKAQLAEHQADILKGAEIWRATQAANPNMAPEQQWQMTLQAARAAGIPVDSLGVPATYDANYTAGLTQIADGLKPQPAGDPNQVVVTPQPGMPAFVYNKGTHSTTQIVAPNDGSQPSASPAGPPTATDAHGNKVQFNAQSGQWEPLTQGGPTQPASGGFPQ